LTEQTKEAFQELKQYLMSSPVMVALDSGEPLFLYIMAATDVVGMVLVTERLGP
jgi:hypothetical protein